MTVTAQDDPVGPFDNTATVATSTPESDDTNNDDTAPVTIDPLADVTVTKTAPGNVDAGSDFDYTITVTNNGPSTADDVTLSDPLPSEVGFVSVSPTPDCGELAGTIGCGLGSLAPGGSVVVTVTVTAQDDPVGPFDNTATVATSTPESDDTNNDDTAPVTIDPLADVTVTKTAPGNVDAGSDFDYSITVTNNGPSTAADVTLSDPLPGEVSFVSVAPAGPTCTEAAGTIDCDFGTLASGASEVVTVTVTAQDDPAGPFDNTATVATSTPESDSTNNDDSAPVTIDPLVDVTVTKTAPANVDAGADFDYSITVTNNGPSTAADVTLSDPLPGEVSFVSVAPAGPTCTEAAGTIDCDFGSLASGASEVVTVTVTAQDDPVGPFDNTATVATSTPESDTTNNDDSAPVTIDPLVDITVTKTAPASAGSGSDFDYSITVTNNGPSTAADVTLSDPLPGEVSFVSVAPAGPTCTETSGTIDCDFGSLANGASQVVTVTVTAQVTPTGPFDNTATVATTTPESDTTNNDDTAPVTITPIADVTVTKTAPASVVAGTEFDYSITVTNNGPATADDVTLSDPLPGEVSFVSVSPAGPTCTETTGTIDCDFGSLASGASEVVTLTVTAQDEAAPSFDNTATVATSTFESDDTNNDDTAPVVITPISDVTVTKTAPANVDAGSDFDYTITVTNNGPSTADSVTLSDPLPGQVSFVSVAPGNPTCGELGGTVACDFGSLASGASEIVTVTVTAQDEGAPSFDNTATVATTTPESDTTNNDDTAPVVIDPITDVTVTKTAPGNVDAGSDFDYTITVTNNGPSTADDVTLSDPLPGEVAFVSVSPAGPTCTEAAGTIDCDFGSLATGASEIVTVTVTAQNDPADFDNTATVATSTPESDDTNNDDTAPVSIGGIVDITVTKTAPANVDAGTDFDYTITVTNNGPSTADAVELTDSLPAEVSFVSVAPGNPTCGELGGTVVCDFGAMANGQSEIVTVTVTAGDDAAGPFDNTAVVSTPTNESDTTNNDDTAPVTIDPLVDITVDKTAPANVDAGTDFDYSITVTNNGPSAADNVTLSDALPGEVSFVSVAPAGPTCTENAGTIDCDFGTLASGAGEIVTVTVTAQDEPASFDNTAVVATTTPESDTTNNDDPAPVTIDPLVDVAVAKTAPLTAAGGENFDYSITVTNNGPSTALNVQLSDPLPAGTSFVSVAPGSPTCAEAAGTVTCDLGALTPVDVEVITVTVTAPLVAGDIVNTATVTTDSPDTDPDNDTDSATTTVSVGSIGDFIWDDLNGDGVQDGGEPGIDGVTVRLLDGGGTETATDVTSGGGLYSFPNLAGGTYTVEVVTATLPPSVINTGDPDGGFDDTAIVVLPPATDDLDQDFGYQVAAGLGDFVWYDLNGDGVQDGGEPGIPGVTVRLLDSGGTEIDSQVTDSSGLYLFSGLGAGTYTVAVDVSTLPGGLVQTGDPDSTLDSSSTLPLAGSATNLDQDFGYRGDGSIGDFVWFDVNGDGVQDGGEPPIPGVPVDLTWGGPNLVVGDGDDVVFTQQITDGAGGYLFENLPAGEYVVNPTGPAGYALTTSNDPSTLVLGPGAADLDQDFGYDGLGSIGDFIWEDLDGDGVQDGGEPGIDGITVELTFAGPDGSFGTLDDVVLTDVTAGGGAYLFDTLPPGDYTVDVISGVPSGLVLTTANDPSSVTLGVAEDDLDQDFGYQSQADLVLTKDVDDDTLLVGETVTWRINATNLGPATAAATIEVVDTVPAGLSSVVASGTDWSCDNAVPTLTCTFVGTPDTLAVGAALPEIVLTGTIDANAASLLTNTATVTSGTFDPTPDNNTDTSDVNTSPAADLTITKSHAGDFIVSTQGSYTIVVANNGPSTSVGTAGQPITVTDTLPTGLVPTAASGSGWSCGIAGQDVTCDFVGSILLGDSAEPITVTVDVTTAAENPSGEVINTAVVTPGPTTDPVLDNNDDDDPTTIVPSADMAIVKTIDAPLVVGEIGSYLLSIDNFGPSDAAGPITVTDTLPTGLTYSDGIGTGWICGAVGQDITCTLPPGLVSGGSTSIVIEVGVDASTSDPISNTATVGSPTFDPDPDNNTSTTEDPVTPTIDLAIDKSHAGDFSIGTTGSYTLLVANNGPSISNGTITVTDTLPAGLTPTTASGTGWLCTVVGQDVTCTFTGAVGVGASLPAITVDATVGLAAFPQVINSATVTPPPAANEVIVDNNTDDDPTDILPLADLTIDKSHVGDFTVGQNGTYTLEVTNLGPTVDPGPITITDDLPLDLGFVSGTGAGWTCDAAGQLVTCTNPGPLAVDASTSVDLTVSIGAATPDSIVNSATVSSPTDDPDPNNNDDSDPTTIIPVADLEIVKSHVGDFVVGTPGTWTLNVTNNGPSTSRGPITVTDTLPDGVTPLSADGTGWVCDVTDQDVSCVFAGDLLIDDSTSIDIEVALADLAVGDIVNTGDVSGTTLDPNPDNDTDDDPATVAPDVDLGVTKALQTVLTQGVEAEWLITVSSNGTSPAAGPITVVDQLPAGLTFTSGGGNGWTCTVDGQTVTCVLEDSLAPGATSSFSIFTLVGADAIGEIENSVSVSNDQFETTLENNADSAGGTVIAQMVPLAPPTQFSQNPQLPKTGADYVEEGVTIGLTLLGFGMVLMAMAWIERRRREAATA